MVVSSTNTKIVNNVSLNVLNVTQEVHAKLVQVDIIGSLIKIPVKKVNQHQDYLMQEEMVDVHHVLMIILSLAIQLDYRV